MNAIVAYRVDPDGQCIHQKKILYISLKTAQDSSVHTPASAQVLPVPPN